MRCTLTVVAAVGIGMAATTPSVWSQGSPAATVTGAWAGWVEVAGNYQPVAATLTTGSTPPGRLTNLLTGVSRPVSNVAVEGARVRVTLADPRFPVLVGTMDANNIAGVAEATGGRTGAFRLLRIEIGR